MATKSWRAGDACDRQGCTGNLVVYTTRINFVGQVRIRFLRCDTCKVPAKGKWIVPLEHAPPRKVK